MKYDKLTDVFSAWADAAAGKSMPRWEEYDKVIRKRYGADIDTEQDLFDVIGRKWKCSGRCLLLNTRNKENG